MIHTSFEENNAAKAAPTDPLLLRAWNCTGQFRERNGGGWGDPRVNGCAVGPHHVLTARHVIGSENSPNDAIMGRYFDIGDGKVRTVIGAKRAKPIRYSRLAEDNVFDPDLAILTLDGPEFGEWINPDATGEGIHGAWQDFVSVGHGFGVNRFDKTENNGLEVVSFDQAAKRIVKLKTYVSEMPARVFRGGVWLVNGYASPSREDSGSPVFRIAGKQITVVGVCCWLGPTIIGQEGFAVSMLENDPSLVDAIDATKQPTVLEPVPTPVPIPVTPQVVVVQDPHVVDQPTTLPTPIPPTDPVFTCTKEERALLDALRSWSDNR